MIDKIEAVIGSPLEHKGLVVQLFVRDGGQWGEIDQDAGELEIEIYSHPAARPWRFNIEELEKVLTLAKERLRQAHGLSEPPS